MLLSLVFTSRTESSRTGKRSRAYDPVNIKNSSRKRSQKREGIGFRRIRTFFIFFRLRLRLLRPLRSAYDLVKTRLSEWEAKTEG